jgi:hypothetical protein
MELWHLDTVGQLAELDERGSQPLQVFHQLGRLGRPVAVSRGVTIDRVLQADAAHGIDPTVLQHEARDVPVALEVGRPQRDPHAI